MANVKQLINSKEFWSKAVRVLFVVLGSALLAFGTAVFLTKLEIVAGGLSGIAIIVQHFIGGTDQYIDIMVAGASVVLFFIGLFFIGKDFAIKTLVSTAAYPAFLALFLRIGYFQDLSILVAGDGSVGYIILCGIFGGVFVGSGVALTFLGGGSTGGVDIIIVIVSEKTRIKESIVSFGLDAVIILMSIILIQGNLVNSLCGVISAFVTALMIEYFYVNQTASIQADVISDKWEEISRFAQDEMMRGATIIKAQGGYKGEERIILRVVFDRRHFDAFKKFLAKTDPKAFVTYTQTNAVYGEGFYSHINKRKKEK
ncbi:MAG: YitT family protein [Bacilli bacterium]|nr:YitT family protein [Bacilli bacterium]MBO4682699.1 YitT family protein [Bacilli bacterium]